MNYLHCSLLSLEYRETRTETAFKTSHLKQSDIYQIEKKILSKIRKINTHLISEICYLCLCWNCVHSTCTFFIDCWISRFFSLQNKLLSWNIYDNTDSKLFFFYIRKKFFFVWNLRKHFISQSLLCFTHRLKYLKKKRCTYDSKKSNHFKLIDWQFKSLSELFID